MTDSEGCQKLEWAFVLVKKNRCGKAQLLAQQPMLNKVDAQQTQHSCKCNLHDIARFLLLFPPKSSHLGSNTRQRGDKINALMQIRTYKMELTWNLDKMLKCFFMSVPSTCSMTAPLRVR